MASSSSGWCTVTSWGWFDDDGTSYEFRWEGNAEMDEAAGTCLLNLQDKDHLEGELTFDSGDSSGFLAKRVASSRTSRKK